MSTIPTGGDGKVTVPDCCSGDRRCRFPEQEEDHLPDGIRLSDGAPAGRGRGGRGAGGDSVAMVALGYDSTLPLTLEEALHHTKAVRRGVQRALWWRTCRMARTTATE